MTWSGTDNRDFFMNYYPLYNSTLLRSLDEISRICVLLVKNVMTRRFVHREMIKIF